MSVGTKVGGYDNSSVSGGSRSAAKVDSTDLEMDEGCWFRAIWVAVAGNINIEKMDGTNEIFENVPVGWFVFSGSKILDTSTTATGLIAVW